MATLTYDANEQVEGELNADEQESLEVGEKLAEEQEQLLAGKFKDAEDLEKAYIELQSKLGKPKEEEAEPEKQPEVKEEKEETKAKKPEKAEDINTEFLDTLWKEASDQKYSKETLDKLGSLDSRDVAQMYLKYRAENEKPAEPQMTEDQAKELQTMVGGAKEYNSMIKWAGTSLSQKEIEMFDAVMDKGDPLSAFFAVTALQYRYNDSKITDGKMITGKAPTEKGDTFRSQAEVVRAMSDPKYDKDPAYRQDVYDKLERSNINF